MENPYLPYITEIVKITDENDVKDIKTFDLAFRNEEDAAKFNYHCGQFAEISVFGTGEAPIGIASSPMDGNVIQFTVKLAGKVTSTLHNMDIGDIVGVRGPYGNGFPMKELEGKNLLIIAGGFAASTLRALGNYVCHEQNRDRFGKVTLFFAARNPGELLYKYDFKKWEEARDTELVLTVDAADDNGWQGKVGFAAPVLSELNPSPDNCVAIVCGPPIMIRTCVDVLAELGFPPDTVLNSLENRMKCGIGKCGRCNVGNKYVCKDGPVFSLAELQQLPPER